MKLLWRNVGFLFHIHIFNNTFWVANTFYGRNAIIEPFDFNEKLHKLFYTILILLILLHSLHTQLFTCFWSPCCTRIKKWNNIFNKIERTKILFAFQIYNDHRRLTWTCRINYRRLVRNICLHAYCYRQYYCAFIIYSLFKTVDINYWWRENQMFEFRITCLRG